LNYLQVGFIAVNKNGDHAGYSLRSGFNYAIYDDENGNRMEDSQFKMSWNN
jgi:N4-(beta-N-acetylglucosaminyl)-L-asparaginase